MKLDRGDESVTCSRETDDQVTTESKSINIFEDYDLYLAAKNEQFNEKSPPLKQRCARSHTRSSHDSLNYKIIEGGYIEVVFYLLKRHDSGAILRDKSGSFPIHHAAMEGHVDIISLLFNYCPADPVKLLDKNGRNILHLAAKNGKLIVATYILQNPELKELTDMRITLGITPAFGHHELASRNCECIDVGQWI